MRSTASAKGRSALSAVSANAVKPATSKPSVRPTSAFPASRVNARVPSHVVSKRPMSASVRAEKSDSTDVTPETAAPHYDIIKAKEAILDGRAAETTGEEVN